MAELMNTEIMLELPVPPSTNTLWKTNRSGRMYKTQKHKEYVRDVRNICVSKRVTPIDGEVGMVVVWYRESRRRDIDSPIKTLLDSLNGFAYYDDKQISELSIYRMDTEPKRPRLMVKIFDIFNEENLPDEDE